MHPTLVLVLCFLLPLLVYASTFIVHVNQNPEYGFVELHKQMFGYHAHLQEGYGYASSWWSWSLLQRPVNYFWEVNQDHQTVQIILNLGNPILWWLGFGCDFVCHLGCAISGRLLARGFSGNGHRNHRLRNLLLSLLDWAPDSTRRILPENVVVQLDLETV
ncbi:MAG: hypothetical protein O7G31_12800 [Calditrichaeota bacterium]|nr:hypothetical protein [Calditrichota bacterium]